MHCSMTQWVWDEIEKNNNDNNNNDDDASTTTSKRDNSWQKVFFCEWDSSLFKKNVHAHFQGELLSKWKGGSVTGKER